MADTIGGVGQLSWRPDGAPRAKPVGTMADIARESGKTKEAVRKALSRAGVQPIDPAPVDKRTPLYWLGPAVAVARKDAESG